MANNQAWSDVASVLQAELDRGILDLIAEVKSDCIKAGIDVNKMDSLMEIYAKCNDLQLAEKIAKVERMKWESLIDDDKV